MVSGYRYLKGVVLGEGDDLDDLADPGEDLMDDVQGDGVHHVLNNHSQHCVRPASLLQKNVFTVHSAN